MESDHQFKASGRSHAPIFFQRLLGAIKIETEATMAKPKTKPRKPRNPFATQAKFRNSAGKMKGKKRKNESKKIDSNDY